VDQENGASIVRFCFTDRFLVNITKHVKTTEESFGEQARAPR
jgi:hypothetical protein